MPFLIPAIKFITSKAPGEELDREEDEIIEEECIAMHEEHALTNKITPESIDDLNSQAKPKKEKKKGRFYKVECCSCEDTKETISVPYAIYYFYTAPVTKFWIYLVSVYINICVARLGGLCVEFRVMLFNSIVNSISVMSWWSVLLVEEIGVLGENHRLIASH